jgi:translation initiation factor 1
MTKPKDAAYREVYSTDRGTICAACSRPAAQCSCQHDSQQQVRGDGNVRVRRETKGRGGKTVTTVSGLALNRVQLAELLAAIKRRLGTGGAEKEGVLEIQGDHCDTVLDELGKRGIKAKRAGG